MQRKIQYTLWNEEGRRNARRRYLVMLSQRPADQTTRSDRQSQTSSARSSRRAQSRRRLGRSEILPASLQRPRHRRPRPSFQTCLVGRSRWRWPGTARTARSHGVSSGKFSVRTTTNLISALSSIRTRARLPITSESSLVRRRSSARLTRLGSPHDSRAVHRKLVVLVAHLARRRRRVLRNDRDATAERREVSFASLPQRRVDVAVPFGVGDVGLDDGVDLLGVVLE